MGHFLHLTHLICLTEFLEYWLTVVLSTDGNASCSKLAISV